MEQTFGYVFYLLFIISSLVIIFFAIRKVGQNRKKDEKDTEILKEYASKQKGAFYLKK